MDFWPLGKAQRSSAASYLLPPSWTRKYTQRRRLCRGDKQWRPVAAVRSIEKLKEKAKAADLWNLFLPAVLRIDECRVRLPLAEIMGRVVWASEVFNCLRPGHRQYGGAAPLRHRRAKGAVVEAALDGEIRSCFAMTEPDVASSDATNIRRRSRRRGRLRNQRPQMVVDRCGRPAVQGRDLHGQNRRRRAEASAAVDDTCSDGHGRRKGRTAARCFRIRRRAKWPRRDQIHKCSRSERKPSARRRTRIRDRPGTTRARDAFIIACG